MRVHLTFSNLTADFESTRYTDYSNSKRISKLRGALTNNNLQDCSLLAASPPPDTADASQVRMPGLTPHDKRHKFRIACRELEKRQSHARGVMIQHVLTTNRSRSTISAKACKYHINSAINAYHHSIYVKCATQLFCVCVFHFLACYFSLLFPHCIYIVFYILYCILCCIVSANKDS